MQAFPERFARFHRNQQKRLSPRGALKFRQVLEFQETRSAIGPPEQDYCRSMPA
jgi:hypothetical protein